MAARPTGPTRPLALLLRSSSIPLLGPTRVYRTARSAREGVWDQVESHGRQVAGKGIEGEKGRLVDGWGGEQ